MNGLKIHPKEHFTCIAGGYRSMIAASILEAVFKISPKLKGLMLLQKTDVPKTDFVCRK
jgi:hypothetical protein